MNRSRFRRLLLLWYEGQRRDLPWRRTRDPYAIWVSEIMLQQTRVATVIPYYERFLARFPTLGALASAPVEDLLHVWSGLGYYGRVRNMQRAAIAAQGGFPASFDAIRALPGIGDYTAAAVTSIAYGLPHAAVDGNVLRVLSRVTNDAGDISGSQVRQRLTATAHTLLDRGRPGDFNQAMMELGATVCLPRQPQCLVCPIAGLCAAREAGSQHQLPVKGARPETVRIRRSLLILQDGSKLLLWRRPPDSGKLAGFWELPEPEHLHHAVTGQNIGGFRHSITNHAYTFEVRVSHFNQGAQIPACHNGVTSAWVEEDSLPGVVLSTTARKAIQLYRRVHHKGT
jgi:A/G-specific adenine glycosylase